MYDILLPVTIYLIDSVLSGMYMQGFLKRKYEKEQFQQHGAQYIFLSRLLCLKYWTAYCQLGSLRG